MKRAKLALLSLFLIALSLHAEDALVADTIETSEESRNIDIQAMREWLNTKRQVTVKELGGNLSVSGEVRTEMIATGETVNGIKQRGIHGAVPGVPTEAYDIECNILLDYRADYAWASVKLEFDNKAGVFGGTLDKLKLEKAYWGVRFASGDTYSMDVEVGRRRFSTVFDSKVEYTAFFDGALLRYDQSTEWFGDLYFHPGVFVIDQRENQYGYVGECGILNLVGTGFYTKYSLIDWDTKEMHNVIERERFDFLISQLIVGYRFIAERIHKQVILYLAGAYNHAARALEITANKRANWGGYLGFSMGEIRKKGDWSLDVNYQVVSAQLIPDFDSAGLGLGNAAGTGLYTAKINGTGAANTRQTAAGNGNFRGYAITLDYLLTNNLNLEQQWVQSVTLDTDIGPFRRLKQYEIELIYAW